MQNRNEAALVRDAALNALGHEFLELGGRVLKISVAGTMDLSHRANGAHAAVRLVRASLEQLDFARRLFGAREQSTDHHRMRAGGERLGHIARVADTAIADYRDTGAFQRLADARDRADLRHANARHNTGRADRA